MTRRIEQGGAAASPDFAAFMDKVLAPLPAADQLDRRTVFEADEDNHLAFALDWLRRNDPRFGGTAQ